MTSLKTQWLSLGEAENIREIAYLARPGRAPGLFWLNGFRSVMTGLKASALDALGAEHGLGVTRFDYSGHGESGGDFDDATIGGWLEEALAVFALTKGPQLVVGSSMGGWLALLLARALEARGEKRLKGLVLIAPAVDATRELIPKRFPPEDFARLDQDGVVERESAYGDGLYRYTKKLIEDGEQHLLFDKVIETGCPVHILQGGQDLDVPPAHAQRLLTHILHDPVTLTMIPDGDHRLSRPEDLARLKAAILGML